ncbi:2'-5' RNA ligase [Gottschalkia acidurici 9a]|uniref:RNA 2',3'-cyclic phosphodiesterase n=1 Tax=Gottschalkia acidurici (strain ATCC 7906 / DSM 604 / BCRC 14475 / CIP 104303 / KCTC 5404 / NCIMB 10678 / 9a) TaxID=1128398 RepID=K0AWL2_GOTA9|nr:RNA 2',3'-cyclic phosphodiesterase [Gottschalkia acidurici]AFS78218.1 2'-5' RNA ligase [Gottschalkia acidurici 9a]
MLDANNKRVFVAIEFPEDIKNYLSKIQKSIIEESEKGNFTTKENLHLTLKFIGEVNESDLEKIKICIDKVALEQNNFQLYFNELGQFPRGNKSIVWVGLESNEILNELYSKLEITLEEIGITREERNFKPHITIGRQVIFNKKFNQIVEQINIDKLSIPVDKISLMESTRVNGELKYIPIHVKKFK